MQIEFEYNKQHYLSISSDYGNPQGEGWYNEGDTAIASIENSVSMVGLLGNLGAKKVFSKWDGDIVSTNPVSLIDMDTSTAVTAVWKDDFNLIYIEAIGIIGLIIILIVISNQRSR